MKALGAHGTKRVRPRVRAIVRTVRLWLCIDLSPFASSLLCELVASQSLSAPSLSSELGLISGPSSGCSGEGPLCGIGTGKKDGSIRCKRHLCARLILSGTALV